MGCDKLNVKHKFLVNFFCKLYFKYCSLKVEMEDTDPTETKEEEEEEEKDPEEDDEESGFEAVNFFFLIFLIFIFFIANLPLLGSGLYFLPNSY